MRYSALALLMAALVAVPAGAQQNPQTREGFWIGFGIGFGSLGCDECDERESGASVYLRMGGTLSQRLLLGGEVSAWSKTEGDVTRSVSNVGPVLTFYPNANGGFFLKGSIGLATASFELGSITIEETGVGLTLGLGYDARVGRGFALTPYFDIVNSSFDGGSFNQVAFGLGFTWP
ncbi:MAG TPA: outer membrane beta-barrel protein [Gemmatimonadaceae bacterium]